MTENTTTMKPAPPTFPYRAYGVSLTWIGDEGGIMAEGHISFRRFAAAANHMARRAGEVCNLADDRNIAFEDVLGDITHRWALPIPADHDDEWRVDLGSRVTADTPGAIPVTLYDPDVWG